MSRLTKLNNTASQIIRETTKSTQKTQFVQILISLYHSTSVSEDMIIPSDVSPKIQKQGTLMEAYEY